jgi:hypothetical protein
MEYFRLACHSANRTPPAIVVEAIALTLATGAVSFRYRVQGDVQRLRIPAPAPSVRTDGLWRHTCFEAFVNPRGAERYYELNFAPSSAWAAYSFDSYRLGMQPVTMPKPPAIQCNTSGDLLTLETTVNLKSLRFDSAIGLSAVIEDLDGGISHWALAHHKLKADFHDAASWTAAFQRFSAEIRA